ncbi:MAG TPA: 3-hydroxyacyl-CoA dehydrogenase NAD-binding domain-containing protein [Anaeromyxobacter sp.]
MQTIETVAVLGATERGAACAVLAALAGCAVRVHDASDLLTEASAEVRRIAELASAQGAVTRTEVQRILDGVLFTSDLDEALSGADLVVDAGTAEPPVDRLASELRATTAVAAAGATPSAELAARLPQPGRVLALRFVSSVGPVPRIEVEPAPETSPHVVERARAFTARVHRAARLPLAAPA